MSEINEFAKDLIKRQLEVYHEYQSEKYNMTQSMMVLMCCSIIIFSDYKEKYNSDSLIKEIKDKDQQGNFKKLIKDTYGDNYDKRMKKYSADEKQGSHNFLNNDLSEYEVFFHDLRNEFAHLIETNQSEVNPNKNGDFESIDIKRSGKCIAKITKEHICNLLELMRSFFCENENKK